MSHSLVIDVDKALEEKNKMQEEFIRDNGYPSPTLILVINHLKEMKKKK